jgi:hypothetical protein
MANKIYQIHAQHLETMPSDSMNISQTQRTGVKTDVQHDLVLRTRGTCTVVTTITAIRRKTVVDLPFITRHESGSEVDVALGGIRNSAKC